MEQTASNYFRIAGFLFRLDIPETWNTVLKLLSFHPFECSPVFDEIPLSILTINSIFPKTKEDGVLLATSLTDLGHVRLFRLSDGYRIEIRTMPGGMLHTLYANPHFTQVYASINREDPYWNQVICSMLRIIFSQAILLHGGVSIHAAAVVRSSHAYLFLGKSGTGKSTHAALWLHCFPESHLLNDDNPVLRIDANDQIMVYGTPWSGKTPCYRNEGYPLGGIVRLNQAKADHYETKIGLAALAVLLPSCSVIHQDATLYKTLCDTLTRLIRTVPIGSLDCLPHPEAAQLCALGLKLY